MIVIILLCQFVVLFLLVDKNKQENIYADLILPGVGFTRFNCVNNATEIRTKFPKRRAKNSRNCVLPHKEHLICAYFIHDDCDVVNK